MIIAKSGSAITESMGFVFTGDQRDGVWEVDLAPAGGRVDGVSSAPISDTIPSDEMLFVLRAGYPQYVLVATSITAGDNLAADGAGKFKTASGSDFVSAKALADDISMVAVLALLFPLGA